VRNPQVLMLLDCTSVGHHSYYASGTCDFDDLSNGYVSVLQPVTWVSHCVSVPSHANSTAHSSLVHRHRCPKSVHVFARSQSSEVTWVWLMSSEILESCLCSCRAPIHVSELYLDG